jgi:hypothetical protein
MLSKANPKVIERYRENSCEVIDWNPTMLKTKKTAQKHLQKKKENRS